MKILYISTERNIDLEKEHEVKYVDYTMRNKKGEFSKKFLHEIAMFAPDFLIEREFNDGISKYPDLVLWVKNNIPTCKRAVWLIDNHCNSEWHIQYATLFDFAFVAISSFMPILSRACPNTRVFWLPLCYPGSTKRIKRNKGKVDYSLVFVGRWGGFFHERTRIIELLKEKYGSDFFCITDYANMEENLRRGVISLNCSLSYDMNFRVFESLANGLELVTNDVPDLHLIKGLEERINIYHSDEELLKMIDDIIEGRRETDVQKNQIWVQNHHSLLHRHRAMLEMMITNHQLEF